MLELGVKDGCAELVLLACRAGALETEQGKSTASNVLLLGVEKGSEELVTLACVAGALETADGCKGRTRSS